MASVSLPPHELPTFEQLCDNTNTYPTFWAVQAEMGHILCKQLPPTKPTYYSICLRSHNHMIPTVHKKHKTFIVGTYILCNYNIRCPYTKVGLE